MTFVLRMRYRAKLVLNKDSVPHKGMRGDRTFTCQKLFFGHKEV